MQCELLLNVVTCKEPKVLIGSAKGNGRVWISKFRTTDDELSVKGTNPFGSRSGTVIRISPYGKPTVRKAG
jgi:hypothetical protein